MLLEQITQEWRYQLAESCPDQSTVDRTSILNWLLGPGSECVEAMDPHTLGLFLRAVKYRHEILMQRYLKASPAQGYDRLMRRLAGVALIRNKLRTWLEQSRDRQRSFMAVLTEVIQEMLETDRYLQRQCQWVQHCTTSSRLRNLLLFASLEEYALRPVQNQPLILRRIASHVRSLERGGVTWAPLREMIHLISEDGGVSKDDEADETASRSYFNDQAIEYYQKQVLEEEQTAQRRRVQQEFELYLNQELGEVAVHWLRLYLQGYSQERIAKRLGVSIKYLYRLREKVSYHAIKIFTLRVQPDLVAEWLDISLQDHNMGLTPGEWRQFWVTLTPQQRLILDDLKQGLSLETIATTHHIRRNQVTAEWGRVYLAAQRFRNQDSLQEMGGIRG